MNCLRCGDPLPEGYESSRPCPRCLYAVGLENASGEVVFTNAGAPLEPAPEPEELAPHFPQLEIIELIGQGGMGIVYRARQRNLDREVALKILRPGPAGGEDFTERFLREARALAKLSHPNIVAVHEFGQAGDDPFLLMELVEGTNLRHLMAAGELGPRECLDLVGQVCAALQYAHDRGVVHRDIKPENILVDLEGRAKIADFGLAMMADPEGSALSRGRLTHSGLRMGTPHYMAPEQIERPGTVDHRADIYSLGVVFYELLTGELPIGRFEPPSNRVQLDVRLDEVVLKSLAKAPEKRYQQASQITTDLSDIQREAPQPKTQASVKSMPREEAPRQKSNRALWVVVALLVFVIGCVPLSCIGMAMLVGARSYEGYESQPMPAPVQAYPSRGPSASTPVPAPPDRRSDATETPAPTEAVDAPGSLAPEQEAERLYNESTTDPESSESPPRD